MREALLLPGCVVDIFATPAALQRHDDLQATATDLSVPVRRCDDDAMATLSGSTSPQGLVVVCRFVDVPLTAALASEPALIAVAANIREPGNAGSLIRCADAAGAGAVVFAGSSVDPYNDKAVRASAGSLFHVPVVVGGAVIDVTHALQRQGFRVLAADAGGDSMLDDSDLTGRLAWLFGNEAWGFSTEERDAADQVVAVPIYGRAESLNVATAAAVCLYATAWSQRAHGAGASLSS